MGRRHGLQPAIAATLFDLVTLAGGGTGIEALVVAAVSAVVDLCLSCAGWTARQSKSRPMYFCSQKRLVGRMAALAESDPDTVSHHGAGFPGSQKGHNDTLTCP